MFSFFPNLTYDLYDNTKFWPSFQNFNSFYYICIDITLELNITFQPHTGNQHNHCCCCYCCGRSQLLWQPPLAESILYWCWAQWLVCASSGQLGGGTSANLGLAPGELVATTGLTTLLRCPLPTTPSINSPLISTLWLLYMDKNWYYDFGAAFKWPLIYKQTKLFALNIEWHCTVVLWANKWK